MLSHDKIQLSNEKDSKKSQIMVVDDEENILFLMKNILQKHGHNVTTYVDAEDALGKLRNELYDLIITDLNMPKLSGIDFIKKAKKASPKTDIVVMTGYPSVETAVECMNNGASDYLTKPLNLEYFNLIVDRLLYKRILEERAAEREYFEHIARIDGLTGLYNRRYFDKLLDVEIARADRYKQSFSLIMIDIDDFKNINDNYGYQIGDNILKELASIINSFIRKTDSATRFGGEEFAIILSHTGKKCGRIFLERIINGIATSKFHGFPHKEIVTASAGLASYPDDAHTQESLIKNADNALYQAKKSGKNILCVYGR